MILPMPCRVSRCRPQQQLRGRHLAARRKCGHSARVAQPGQDGRETRQQHPRLGAGQRQRGRQRAGHIGQATGLEQRKDLSADLQYPHAQSFFSMSRVTSTTPLGLR